MQKVQSLGVVIAGRSFNLDPAEVEKMARTATSEPVRDHFVVVAGERFPPKQLLGLVTDLDRSDFTTVQARSIFRRLGFATGRLARLEPERLEPTHASERQDLVAEAERLRPYLGRWVALKDGSVVFAADSPRAVLKWLRKNNLQGSLLKVPLDPSVDIGGFSL